MMKKYNKLLLVIALALYVPFSAIRTAYAASNIVYATGGTFTEGEYNVYTAQASSGSYLQFYAFDKYYSFDQYHSACIVKIDLDDIYSGDITLNFSSNYTMFPLWWVETEQGSCGIDGINKQIILHLQDVQSLTIYLCSTNTSSNGIQPTSVDSSLTRTSDAIADLLADYQVELQSLPAWIFATNSMDGITYDNSMKYPVLNITAGQSSKNMVFYSSNTYVFYCMLGSGQWNNTTIHSKNGNVNVEAYSLPYYRFNGGYRIWRITISLTAFSEATDAIVYENTSTMIPLYFGDGRNMTVEMQSLLGVNSENLTTDLLNQIIAIINQQQTQDDQNFIDDMSSTVSDYTASETTIHDFFDTSMNDIDLDDYSIPASLAATTQWLVSQMENIFYEVPDLRILFVLPLVLGIALFFIGRGSVIFRQGNIDRARQVAYGDTVAAEVAKDNMDSQAMKGAAARFGQNERRMEQHHTHTFGYHERNSK